MIISVLVVLVGGLIGFASTQLLTKHTSVLVVAQDVPVGATISSSDLSVASVTTAPGISTIPASQESQIVGLVAQVGLVKGTNLTRAQVGTASGFTPGEQLVALALKQGQFPARGLSAGEKILIVATPGQGGSTTSSTAPGGRSGSPGAGAANSGIDATVVDVGGLNQATQVTVVDVRVASTDGVPVAQLASTGNVSLILLPAGR